MPTTTKPRARKAKPDATANGTGERELKYPDRMVKQFVGDKGLTADKAQALLGWEEVAAGADFDFLDVNEKKVRCRNNSRNRRFIREDSLGHAQKMLRRQWKFTHQGMGVSKYGEVIDGNHRLVGLVFAEQIRTGPKAAFWAYDEKLNPTGWAGPVMIETTITFGLDDDKETLRQIDANVRPRTFADVLYTEGYFSSPTLKRADEVPLCKIAEHCVRMLWERTGAKLDPYAGRFNSTEGMEFLLRHPRVKDAILHCYEEDGDKSKIGKFRPVAYMAALMYLFGMSASDGDAYRAVPSAAERSEAELDASLWKRAEDFVVALAQGGKDIDELRLGQRPVRVENAGEYVFPEAETELLIFGKTKSEGVGSAEERNAWLVKGWLGFVGLKKTGPNSVLRREDICPGYGYRDGEVILAEIPDCGGIDLAPAKKAKAEKDDEGESEDERDTDDSVTEADGGTREEPAQNDNPDGDKPAEIEARKRKVKAENGQIKATEGRALTVAERIEANRVNNPGKILLYRGERSDQIHLFGDDAVTLGRNLDPVVRPKMSNGVPHLAIAAVSLEPVVERLKAAGFTPAIGPMTDNPEFVDC